MALPLTQKKWVLQGNKNGLDEFQFIEGPIPKIGDHEVLVKLHAASINHREILMSQGLFAFATSLPVVGGSDGAGEVVAVGSKVTKWEKGDMVVTLFNPGHQIGPLTAEAHYKGGIGGTADGTFQEYGAFEETGLVRLATNLSYLEGASLPDAGVTAWNALYGLKPLLPGQWIMVQGTGGVSLFALQFAKAGGAKVVAITSSSDKYNLLQSLGADHVINYREDPNWGTTARKLTPNNEGLDMIIDVGGNSTLSNSIQAIKFEGIINIVGISKSNNPPAPIIDALLKICTFRGLHVGSRIQMEEMMAEIEKHGIQPVLDQTIFAFDQLRKGLGYVEAQKQIGKVIVKII